MNDRVMVIHSMDPILVQIYGIKDIEEISLSDFAPSTAGAKFNVLPNLYVRYDGGKVINLCSMDKYFDVFVRKVYQVYKLEKDKVIVDPTFDPFGYNSKLTIDDKTKAVLESGDLLKVSNVYSFYDQKKSYGNSLIFQSDEFMMLFPLIKYQFKQAIELTDNAVSMSEESIGGYRNNYAVMYKFNGIPDMLLINFDKEGEDEFYLTIRSRDRHFNPLNMLVKFNDNSIDINCLFKDYDLCVSDTYEVRNNNTANNNFIVSRKGETIVYKNIALEETQNPYPNLSGIDNEDDLTWFKLPWNAYYGVNNFLQKLSEVDGVVNTHNKYLAITGDNFLLREFLSREYQRRKTFEANANRIVLDEAKKRIYGFIVDQKEGLYILEAFFANALRANGYYETYLDDKYFYMVAKNKNKLKGLNRSDLVSISQDDEIIKGVDLYEKDQIKKILKE